MSTKPYLFVYAMAFGVGVPILGLSLKPSAPSAPNPKVDSQILREMAYGGNGVNAPAVATPQDKPSASDEDAQGTAAGRTALATLADLQGGTKRAELQPLPNLSMEFGTKPAVPSQALVVPTADNASDWLGGGASSSGDGNALLPPPPIFGAFPFGSIGGFGVGGTGAGVGGSLSGEGQYFLVGPPGGFFGDGGSGGGGGGIGGDGGFDDGGDGGGGILFVGGGAVPEPASWLLGFCAMGALIALRLAIRREQK